MNTGLPVELFKESKDKLKYIKNNLSAIFEDIGAFVIHTSNEMGSFKNKIALYVEYFYPGTSGPAEETFLKIVVEPGREEMKNSISEVLETMEKNEVTRNAIDNGINNILGLREKIDISFKTFNEIKKELQNNPPVYKENNPAGIQEHLNTLNKIYNQMEELSSDYGNIISELDIIHNEFNGIKEWINNIQDEYLNKVKDSVSNSFDTLEKELKDSAEYMSRLINHIESIDESIKKIINKLQMEDIERQNLEKITYFIEEIFTGGNEVNLQDRASIENNQMDRAVSFLIENKISEVKGNFSNLLKDLDSCFIMVKDNLNNFNEFYANTDQVSAAGTANEFMPRLKRLDSIYHNMKELEDDFILNLKYIIERIKILTRLLYTISLTGRKFNNFIKKVMAISNNIKKITQDNVLNSQADINKQISEFLIVNSRIVNFYTKIKDEILKPVTGQQISLLKQEEALQTCIFSLGKVSVKLNESQNHFMEISREIWNNSIDILNFIKHEDNRLLNLKDAHKTISLIVKNFKDYSLSNINKEQKGKSFLSEINSIKENFESTESQGDYRKMMIVSLLNEFIDQKSELEVEFF